MKPLRSPEGSSLTFLPIYNNDCACSILKRENDHRTDAKHHSLIKGSFPGSLGFFFSPQGYTVYSKDCALQLILQHVAISNCLCGSLIL